MEIVQELYTFTISSPLHIGVESFSVKSETIILTIWQIRQLTDSRKHIQLQIQTLLPRQRPEQLMHCHVAGGHYPRQHYESLHHLVSSKETWCCLHFEAPLCSMLRVWFLHFLTFPLCCSSTLKFMWDNHLWDIPRLTLQSTTYIP